MQLIASLPSDLASSLRVDERKPVFSISSSSPALGEDTVLLKTFARGQQQFPALLLTPTQLHANPFASLGLRSEAAHPTV